MKKRILSFFLALVMLFSCMSLNIFATEETGAAEPAESTVVSDTFDAHTDAEINAAAHNVASVANMAQALTSSGGVAGHGGNTLLWQNGKLIQYGGATAQSRVQTSAFSVTTDRNNFGRYDETDGKYRGEAFVLQQDRTIYAPFVGAGVNDLVFQISDYISTVNGSGYSGHKHILSTDYTWPNLLWIDQDLNLTAKNATSQTTQTSVTVAKLEVGKTYTISVYVDPQDVDPNYGQFGIYGSFNVYLNGECVAERLNLFSKEQNASLTIPEGVPYAHQNAWSDMAGKVLNDKATVYFFQDVAPSAEELASILKEYGITVANNGTVTAEAVGTKQGVKDLTLAFVRYSMFQKDFGKDEEGNPVKAFELDNLLWYTADDFYGTLVDHSYVTTHTHDEAAGTVTVTTTCEYCDGKRVEVLSLDANEDGGCDVCYAELIEGVNMGGVLPTYKIADLADSIIYVSDTGSFNNMSYNGGAMITVTDDTGNTYLKFGVPDGQESITLSKQTYGQTDNVGFNWPYQISTVKNYDALKGKSYVYSSDFKVEDGLDKTVPLFTVMCYMKLSNGNGLADMNIGFVKINQDGDVLYRNVVEGNENYSTGVNIKDGKFHNIAFYHTPAGDATSPENTFDLYIDGVMIVENAQALSDAENSGMNFTATLDKHNGSYEYPVNPVTFNGAKDFIPAVFRTYQYGNATVINGDQFSIDNIKIYYSDVYFDHYHEYEIDHSHDIADNKNTVTFTCECGHIETVEREMHDNTGKIYSKNEFAQIVPNAIVNSDLTDFSEIAVGSSSSRGGVTVSNSRGGLTFETEYGMKYAKFGNNTGSADASYIQVSYKMGWEDVQKLINADSELIGAPYVFSVDFAHYGTKNLEVISQIASYIHSSNSAKVVSFAPLNVKASGERMYRDGGEEKTTGQYLVPGTFYNLAIKHTPATNSYDIFVNGKCVIKGAKALDANSIEACTWTNSNGKKISEKSFIPGFIRSHRLSYTNTIGDLYAMSNLKLYHSATNVECGHSFVKGVCEWCGEKDADFAHCDICDGTAISANAAVVSKSASLGEMIDMNVYMALSEKLVKTEGAKVTLNCGNRSAEYALADAVKEANGLYKFSIELRSTQMASDVEVKVVGETSDTYKTSIKAYAEELIEANVSEKATALAKAMLNYGATAQKYFAIKNDDATLDDALANAGLSAADQKVDAEIMNKAGLNALTYAPNDSDPLDGVQFTAATIMFSAKTHVKVYFTASENATVTVGGRQVTPIASENEGEYYVTFTVENPAEAMTRVSIVVNDGAASVGQDFSAGLLVKVGVDANANAELTALLLAYANYAYCASNYAI